MTSDEQREHEERYRMLSKTPRCSTCVAWKLKPNQAAPIFGGCARSGTTTLHYGTTAYNHYTTDLQSCSAWEAR